MRSLRGRVCAAVLSHAIVLSTLVAGQSATMLPHDKADQAFSVIQTSLARAADSALNEAQMEKQTAESGNKATAATARTIPRPLRNSQARIGRLDSLRSMVEPILAREGVPGNLSAVILVESAGNPLALSPKGARGLWQLMPDTARRYGLRVDSRIDQRIEIEKSTTAAAQYLRHLYAQFGSWPLALAAYNTGERHLQRAIYHAGRDDLATLSFLQYLPDETREYVPAVLVEMGKPRPIAIESTPTVEPRAFVYAFSAATDNHDQTF